MVQNFIILIQTLFFLIGQLPDRILSGQEGVPPHCDNADSLPVYGYQIINEYPHDSTAFTQGLMYKDGFMYESTGLYGESSLRKVVFESGTVTKIHHLASSYFGEGITIFNDTIRQLTWQEYVGFVYDENDSFDCIDTFSYTTEGWGLTHNDSCLIMSDGSSTLYFLDPQTYQEVGQIMVTAESVEVYFLNELEYIQDRIYANIWFSDSIAVIDPLTGNVECWIDLTDILPNPPNVLNGIAFDPENIRLFVTGKRWRTLFEIEIDPINYRPQIINSYPPSPCSITVDSTLLLGINATDPDPGDSLEFIWMIDGVVDTSAHDSSYAFLRGSPTIDTVVAIVTDSMYSDSVTWVIYVSAGGIAYTDEHERFLHTVIPNPMTKGGSIKYSLSERGHIIVRIFDVTGREICVPVDVVQGPGDYEFNLSGIQIAGVYFIHLMVEQRSCILKTIFVQ